MKNVPLWNIYLCMNTHPAAVQSMLTEARCTSHFIFASCSINNFKTSVSHCPIYTEVWCFPWLACFCIANTWKKRDLMTTTNTNFWSYSDLLILYISYIYKIYIYLIYIYYIYISDLIYILYIYSDLIYITLTSY